MQRRPLGNTGRETSLIGFGGAAVSGSSGGYGFGNISESDALDLLVRAYDAGINLFDSAPIYGYGESERRIAKALKHKRDEVILTSKSGVTWDLQKRSTVDNSRDTTQRMLHQSLRDLDTEIIDVYFIHWPDANVDIRVPMEILSRAKEQGKIRHIGLSNTYPEDLQKAQEIDTIDVLQGEFNFFASYPKDALFPLVDQHQLGFMAYGTFDKGILTGRVDANRTFEDPSDVRSHASWWTETDRSQKYETMEKILPHLEAHGHTGAQLALAYIMRHPQVSTALCGSKNPNQLQSTLDALQNPPSPQLIDECIQISQRIKDQNS